MQSSVFNRMQHAIVANEIETLISKGVVKHSSREPGEFISPIFLRPKPDGTYRMIHNLRTFNEFVQYHHFKMDTLEMAVKMMKPGCFMSSIDLKDAYYTVPIFHAHQKYQMDSAVHHEFLLNSLSQSMQRCKVTHHPSALRMLKSRLRF